MARQWQATKYKEFVMPDAVYYQSIWAVRDLIRMEERLRELEEEENLIKGKSVICDQTANFVLRRPTEEYALEEAVLRERIGGIRKALEVVPAEYRSFILSNLILQNSGKSFPDKKWRYWKQKFLYHVAKNLTMI